MIIDQLFTRPLFEESPMASPEQLAYNKLRAQYDGYQAMTSGGGNTAVSRDPAHAAKLATVPAELARMAAALKAKGIDAEAQYDVLSGPKAAPVDANQAYSESGLQKFSHKKNRFRSLHKLQNPLGEEGSGSTDRDNADYMKRRNAAKKAGYTGRETKAGTWRVFKDGNAVAAAGPFKSADEAAAWIKKHKQGITEMDKSQPSAGRDGPPRPGPDREAKPITAKKATKDAADMLNRAFKDSRKKKDVNEAEPTKKSGVFLPLDGSPNELKKNIYARYYGEKVVVDDVWHNIGDRTPMARIRNKMGFSGLAVPASALTTLNGERFHKIIPGMAWDDIRSNTSTSTPDGRANDIENRRVFDRVSAEIDSLNKRGAATAPAVAAAPAAAPAAAQAAAPAAASITAPAKSAIDTLNNVRKNIGKGSEYTNVFPPVGTDFQNKQYIKDLEAELAKTPNDPVIKAELKKMIGRVNSGIDPLMNKLQEALIKEGRVKELADDLKTMSDADFMKKYGKAKAAIRKDMKRVDEAEGQTVYTKQEIIDVLTGKKTQQQVDDERAKKPLKEIDAPAMPAAPAAPATPAEPDEPDEPDEAPQNAALPNKFNAPYIPSGLKFDATVDPDAPARPQNFSRTYDPATKKWTTTAPIQPALPDPAAWRKAPGPGYQTNAIRDRSRVNGVWRNNPQAANPMSQDPAQRIAGYQEMEKRIAADNAAARAGVDNSDPEAYEFDHWLDNGMGYATPVLKSGAVQGLFKKPLSKVPPGAKILPQHDTYQQQGEYAYPVDATGGMQQAFKVRIDQVPKGAKIVQAPQQSGALFKNLPGAAPATPPAAPAAAKPAGPAAPKPAAPAPAAAKPGETPMAKAAAVAPVSERKGTRRLREADPATINNPTMTSRTMGAPELSADPIQNFKNGVADAKEFYDLARQAGVPVSDAIPMAYAKGQATATGDIGSFVKTVSDKATGTAEKGLAQLQSTIKDYADLYAQFQPTSEYYKKNISPNPQLKAQADEFIRTNMTPQQYAQSIQQAQAQLKAPRAMPTQASATVPGNPASQQPAAPINELSTNKLSQYKTAAARDAKKADQAGDFKRGDKRLSGMVQATKKQFDNDAKKVDESRAARRALMARIVNSR